MIWENKYGITHRSYDLPSLIYRNHKYWHKNGSLHRDGDNPAVIRLTDIIELRHNNRRDNPMYEWVKEGKMHREGDKPAAIWPDGSRMWCIKGFPHRENGKPAIITKEYQEFYVKGEFIKREYLYKTQLETDVVNKPYVFVILLFLIIGTIELLNENAGLLISFLLFIIMIFGNVFNMSKFLLFRKKKNLE